PTATIDKKLKYYSTNPNSRSVEGKITSAVNSVLIDNYFSSKELSQGDLNYAMSRVNMDGFRITEDEKIEEEGVGNRILSFLFAFLLYFSLLFTGQSMITSVLEEKSSRIVEVILASVSTSELMAGKILGSALIGVVQMAIWLSPVLVIISTSIFVLPPELILSITAGHLLYFLVNFLVGLVLFLGLYATLGAIFDNPQDAQSGNLPIMMLIIIPFFITFSMVNNPNNTLATVSSMFPFSSIIVMPSRMTLVDVPLWQFAVSIFLNIAVMFLIFPFAGKIYRVGILRTGKKPSWAEVAKWLRYKN
ncbi:MAG: ABC transporter permease, partial [Ignavibacteriales bacterium]|nr:ABC transporter permease [Ignavibacteriales bacterium]